MLLDSASLYFRAYFGVPDSIKAPDGQPVNAVRGFLDMIAFLVTDRRPARLVACWDDDWRPDFRVKAIPSYKAHRVVEERPKGVDVEEVPDTLEPQVPVIADVLAALGIARIGAPGFEADDVMATLAERAARAKQPVDLVTGDRDMFQLVDDARDIRVLYAGKGIRNLECVDQAWLRAKYGVVDGAQYGALALLRGDPSDGLPGVPGVGEKTAAALLKNVGDLEGLRRAIEANDPSIKGALRTKLEAAREYLAVAPSVVNAVRDVPIAKFDDELPKKPADPKALAQLSERWNLASSVKRVVDSLAG
jgi:5'-3' exonuclease